MQPYPNSECVKQHECAPYSPYTTLKSALSRLSPPSRLWTLALSKDKLTIRVSQPSRAHSKILADDHGTLEPNRLTAKPPQKPVPTPFAASGAA